MPEGALATPQFAPDVPVPMMTAQPSGRAVSQPEDRHVRKAPPKDQPFLSDGDMLLVKNDGERDLNFRWAGKAYPVSAHGEEWVIFEALVDQLGDPRSQDNAYTAFTDSNGTKGMILDRHMELCRLYARYAVENEDMSVLVQKAPKVRVFTAHNQHVMFPCQLPDMLPLPVVLVEENRVNSDISRMHDSLQADNADLRAQIERLEEMMNTVMKAREGVDAEV